MKSLRITVVMSVFVLSLGMLTLFMAAVGKTIAAPAEQSGVAPERAAEEEAARPGESFGPDDTGGPDAYGYTFIDSNELGGPIYSFVEISTTGTSFPLPDNSLTGPLDLGFDFNFYGTTYTQTAAASNGYLWFDNGIAHAVDSTPDCPLPNTLGNENYIAVLHDDLDGQQNVPNGLGYYEAFAPSFCPYGGYGGACFIVEWDGTYHDTTTDDLTFQVILFDDNTFLMQYQDAGNEAGSASTTGIENTDATIALNYACDAASTITDNLAILFQELSGPYYGASTKNGPTAVVAGEPITYTLVISNSGTTSGTNTILTDTIPVGTTYVTNSLSCGGGTGSCIYSAGTDAVNWAGSIEAGEMVTVEFAVDTTLTVCGGTITNLATITDPAAFGSPYELELSTGIWDQLLIYDFEADDGGFVPGFSGFPGPSDWEWGVPTAPPALGATSGISVWATILDGLHNNNNGSSLLTKTVDLTGFSDSAQLSWSHFLQANNSGFDFGTVRVNGDTVFDSSGDPDTPDWTTQSVSVGAYAGGSADIVFDFFATAGTNDFGWYLDDVTIASCDPPDTPVFDNSSKSAPGTAASGSTYTYTVSINNTGGVSATNTVMTDAIPTGTTYVPGSATNGATFNSGLNQIEWTGTISPAETIDVSFMVTATLGSGVITNTAVITHPDITAPVMVSATTTIIGSATYPVCADFETGALPGYFFTETTSNGAANGRVAVTTAFPHTGSWGLDLDTDCNNCGGNTQQAAIMVVDLAGQSGVVLDFWVFEHADENHPEDGVFISDDGGATWALIQSLNNFPSSYVHVSMDLDAAVANAGMSYVDGFMLRFQSLDGSTIPGADGYSFDDICVEPGQPEVAINPTDLSSTQFTNQVITQSLFINNVGNVDLNWNITEASTACNTPAPVPWANAVPGSGTTAGGGSSLVDVAFDSTGLSPAVYNGLLCVNSDDPNTPVVTATLTLTVEGAPVIVVAPNSLSSTQDEDTQVTQTLTISNVGNVALNWDIVEQDSVVNFDSAVGADARQVTDPADAGNIEFDTAASPGVHTNPIAAGNMGPTFAPEGFVLYDNGSLVNGPGTGVGGADESILQTTSLGMNTLGFGNHLSAINRVADDFTIPAGATWELDQITFFAYQTGSPTASTMTAVNLRIWDGEPGNGGTVIWGDTTTDVMINTVWSGIYRVTETTTGTAVDRPIMANTADLGGLVLPAGTYWLDWQSDGTLASGPFAPPITIAGVAVTGNGLVTGDNGVTWAPANDSGTGTPRQGFPFIIEGTPGCAAGDIPWAAASPTSGTTAAGTATDVAVTFDSTGLSAGVYTGTLCVTSDDPINPLVEVPLTLTVEIENMAPVAVADVYTTTQDMVLNVPAPGVLDNDNDPDGDDLTAVLDTDVSDGTLTLNADGSFTYTPDTGFSGTDSFTYHANDGTADSNIVTVTIDVIVTEYKLYLPIVRQDGGAQAAGENWASVALAAFPMMLGMWVVVRRNGRFDG